MGHRFTVGDFATGRKYRAVELVSTSWATVFDDADTLSGGFKLRAIDPRNGQKIWPDARSEAAVAKSYLACEWVDDAGGSRILAAGPIWVHNFDDDSGVLTINAAGAESYFDHRKLIPVLAANQGADEVTTELSGSLALIAKKLVQQARTHAGGNPPIVFPDDVDLTGPSTDREWPGYELLNVGGELRSITAGENGPEVQFVPRWRADDPRFIEWVMRIGTPATDHQIRQRGNPWLLDRTTTSGPISKADVVVDGSKMGDRAWSAGTGMGTGREIALAEDTTLRDFGYPLLEVETRATDTVSEAGTLSEFAGESLMKASRPAETISLTVNATAFWKIAESARPGDRATLRIGPEHGYLPAGDIDVRILDLRGSGEETVTVSCAERKGEI